MSFVEFEKQVTEDYLEIVLTIKQKITTEYHMAVTKPQPNTFLPHSKKSLNIALIMYDSQSHSNIQRNFKKTYKMLESDPNSFIFNGHSIVGE